MLAPPGKLAPPPRGNPGSATDQYPHYTVSYLKTPLSCWPLAVSCIPMGIHALIFYSSTYGFAILAAVLWGGSLFTLCTVLCSIVLRPIVLTFEGYVSKLITLHDIATIYYGSLKIPRPNTNIRLCKNYTKVTRGDAVDTVDHYSTVSTVYRIHCIHYLAYIVCIGKFFALTKGSPCQHKL